MGELVAFSESSLLQLPQTPLCTPRRRHLPVGRRQASLAVTSPMCFSSTRLMMFPTFLAEQKQYSWRTRASSVSDSTVPTTCTVESSGEGIDILPESGGSDDNFGGASGNTGGGGGRGGNDDNHDKNGEEWYGSEDRSGCYRKEGLSMSQKLTLGYAALVGVGGLTGYLKGGSQKSLIAGGLSASLLYYVYTLRPSNPVLASSLGLILSASLLGLMGSRFKKSGKMFPAGIVSFASLVMTGGYLHGILLSLH